jgi:hypothetical protein
MLIAWNVNSQNDTRDSVTVSLSIAKKIQLDLLDYDRLIENKTEENLNKCIRIQKEKDTVIYFLEQQSRFSKETLLLTEKQLEIREEQLKLTKKNKKGWLFGTGGVLVGALIGVLIGK